VRQVCSNAGLDGRIGNPFGYSGTVGSVSDLFADLGQIVLAVGVLNVNQQLGPFAHEVSPTAQQITSGTHLGLVDVGHRDHAAAQQDGDFLGVDAIVLALPPWMAFM